MCGIAMFYSKQPVREEDTIKAMIDIISHRGPDGEGMKGLFGNTLWLGHRRLAIIDLSDAGAQPMSYQGERFWISYNGEIYNYIELRQQLACHGHRFVSGSDTEVILAAYAEWGADCVSRFNGMWAFVLVDVANRQVFASRDRFGVKPFYYSVDKTKERLAVGSEIKQLRKAGFGSGRANRERTARFIIDGDVNIGAATMFEDIFQLEPGYSLEWKIDDGLDAVNKYRYYTPAINFSTGAANSNTEELQATFNDLFEEAVRIRLRSDVVVGSCLSGGLDSSSIVVTAKQLLTKANIENGQQVFTSCFTDSRYDEWDYAKLVAQAAGANSNQVFPAMDNLFDEIDALCWHQEEPFLSTSIYAQWNVMRMANQKGIKVLLDGQGADEVMAGYHSYFPLFFASLIKTGNIPAFIDALVSMSRTGVLSATDNLGSLFKKTVYFLSNAGSLIDRHKRIKTILDKEYQSIAIPQQPASFQKAVSNDIFGSLQKLLRYEDRNSMAFSIEARTPFLDYRLVELFLAMPGILKYQEGWTKPFLRKSMNGLLPRKVQYRVDKKGFVTPETDWYKRNYATISGILLADSLLFEWVNRDALRSWLSDPAAWQRDFTLWRLLSVVFWLRRFNLQ